MSQSIPTKPFLRASLDYAILGDHESLEMARDRIRENAIKVGIFANVNSLETKAMDVTREVIKRVNETRERVFRNAVARRFGENMVEALANKCQLFERRMNNGDIVQELKMGGEILVRLTEKHEGCKVTLHEEYPEMPTKDVEPIEVTVTKYKTKDGQVFEKEAKAEEHAAILRGDAKICDACGGTGLYDNVGDGRHKSSCRVCRSTGVLYRQEVWGPK